MKRFKMFADFDKEEAWLNRMAAAGHLLVSSGLVYTFAPIAPGSAVVRVDYRETMKAADFDDYRNLFHDAGWQHLAGTRSSGAQYFASFSGDAHAEIFSDAASKAQRYKRAIAMHSAVLLPLLIIVTSLFSTGALAIDMPFAPRGWYLTPGLWQMQGAEFARAFLFETPFVLLRTGAPMLLIAGCLVLALSIGYLYLLYRRTLARADAVAGTGAPT